MTCTCDEIDVTSVGDSTASRLFIPDPDCPDHGERPVGACVVCENDTPVGQLSWEEHDPRKTGWWCQPCRRDRGFGFLAARFYREHEDYLKALIAQVPVVSAEETRRRLGI